LNVYNLSFSFTTNAFPFMGMPFHIVTYRHDTQCNDWGKYSHVSPEICHKCRWNFTPNTSPTKYLGHDPFPHSTNDTVVDPVILGITRFDSTFSHGKQLTNVRKWDFIPVSFRKQFISIPSWR
jgi:hypothetical protein